MKRFATFIIFITLTVTAVIAQNIAGSWTGKLNVGGTELNVVLNFTKDSKGKLSCTLDSPDQGAKGIPAEVVSDDLKNLEVTINAIGATYVGTLKDGVIEGTFTQNGVSFPLNMKPGAVSVNRPQEPKAPFTYTTKEVEIHNTTENVILSGTLTYPEDYGKMRPTDVPVVVMVTGSGQQNRDEELFGHKPFLVIADYLARHGIASLRYDDRGTGSSSGDASTTTIQTNMDDAESALNFVRKLKDFGKAGILGHSEGGMIAFMLGAKNKPDFIVCMAAPGVRGDSVLIEQNRIMLRYGGMTEKQSKEYCDRLRHIFDLIINCNNTDDAETLEHNVEQQLGQGLPNGLIKSLCSPWMRQFLSYDPSDDIRHTVCPVMAINGTSDIQVFAPSNLSAIRYLLSHNNKLNLIKKYNGLNHLFQHSLTGNPLEYGKIEETISPEVLQDIATWINSIF